MFNNKFVWEIEEKELKERIEKSIDNYITHFIQKSIEAKLGKTIKAIIDSQTTKTIKEITENHIIKEEITKLMNRYIENNKEKIEHLVKDKIEYEMNDFLSNFIQGQQRKGRY